MGEPVHEGAADYPQGVHQEPALKGIRISACLHVTAETANLAICLRDGGADVVLCASNPLSTQDDVAASLVRDQNIPVYAIKGEDNDTYYNHILAAIDHKPHITMDDGADLVTILHTKRTDALEGVIGGTEETTTGVIRLRAMAKEGVLKFPIVAVNDADTKHLFDNRYGTGQSTIDGIIRATNFLLAGSKFVVAGYGWCGRGLRQPRPRQRRGSDHHRSRSHQGARSRDGRLPRDVDDRSRQARRRLLHRHRQQERAHQGALRADERWRDHFELGPLQCGDRYSRAGKMSSSKRTTRTFVEEYSLKDGRKINLLGEGRLINLAAAEGHPASVMDMSFADQALSVEYMVKNYKTLEKKVYRVPDELDKRVAKLKLESMGIKIDRLTPEQEEYLAGWSEGT